MPSSSRGSLPGYELDSHDHHVKCMPYSFRDCIAHRDQKYDSLEVQVKKILNIPALKKKLGAGEMA